MLLRVGQLLILACGAEALTTNQGLAHDASSARERDRNLAGLIGAPSDLLRSLAAGTSRLRASVLPNTPVSVAPAIFRYKFLAND